MFYQCQKCNTTFEHEHELCPGCGMELDYTLYKPDGTLPSTKAELPKGISPMQYMRLFKKTPLPVNMEQVKAAPKEEAGVVVLPSPNADYNQTNTGLSTFFNVFWIIFVGIASVIENFFLGIGYCLTIVGIPAGITCFKFIPLVFRPAGRTVLLDYKSHPFLNTVSLIFGGWFTFLFYNIIGVLLHITIIGIPLGRQMFKIAKFFVAPFGSKIVLMDNYTSSRDTRYDYKHLFEDIALEDKMVQLSNGNTVPASDALCMILNDDEKDCCYPNANSIAEIECYIFIIPFCMSLALILAGVFMGGLPLIIMGAVVLVMFLLICFISPAIVTKTNAIWVKTNKSVPSLIKKAMPIATYYPCKQYYATLKGKEKREHKKKYLVKIGAQKIMYYNEQKALFEKIINSKQSRNI